MSGKPRSQSSRVFFGYCSTINSLQALHPSPPQTFMLWEVFKENVDPVLKMFHRPTVSKMLLDVSNDRASILKPGQALFFAVYYDVVVSLSS